MKTKEKILLSALKLYNHKGLYNVSSRDICKDLSISPGNFSYHYPSTQRLCTDLFGRLILELETAAVDASDIQLNDYINYRINVMTIQHRYRFFYLNLYDIIQKFDGIKDFYVLHYEEEKSKLIQVIRAFELQGFFHQTLTEQQLKAVLKAMIILQNSWLTDASVQQDDISEAVLYQYLSNQLIVVLMPHLQQGPQQELLQLLRI